MSLRCKKDDMAMILKGPYSGHFVTVKEFMGRTLVWRLSTQMYEMHDNLWDIEAPSIPLDPGMRTHCMPDAWLLPIRPGDLQETEEKEKEILNQ